MENPVIVAIDDDPQVLRAVERDLRSRFGSAYRIVAADSGATALDVVRRLKLRGSAVALFLSDQRMPEMSGVEFLTAAREIYPDAKRILLTAYADTEVAITAINTVQLDHYILKPWDPPEEKLFPVLEDVLGDWQANFQPPYEGIRIISHRWSPRAHEIKDYLARNQIPYRWLDAETDPEATQLATSAGVDAARQSVVVFADGTHLVDPSNADIAGRVGLRTHAALPQYDLVIVGGGPSGLAAAVYGASEGLKTLMVEREAPGGQAGTTSRIENYLGFPAGLSGADLARRAVVQASRLGAEVLTPQEVVGRDPRRSLQGGPARRRLKGELPGAARRHRRRIPEADAPGCRPADRIRHLLRRRDDRGDPSIAASASRSRAAATPPARPPSTWPGSPSTSRSSSAATRSAAGMSAYLVDQIAGDAEHHRPGQHQRHWPSTATEVLESVDVAGQGGRSAGEPAARRDVRLHRPGSAHGLAGRSRRARRGRVPAHGRRPRAGRASSPPAGSCARQPFLLETNVPGILCAGDVRANSVKRIASSVGEGAMAVRFVHQVIAEQ